MDGSSCNADKAAIAVPREAWDDGVMKTAGLLRRIWCFSSAFVLLPACSGWVRTDEHEDAAAASTGSGGPAPGDAGAGDADAQAACAKDCGGGSCEQGVCAPVVLAAIEDLGCPVLDGAYVYVADPGGARILRVAKAKGGAEPEVIASDAGEPRWMTVRDGFAYWTSQPLGVFRVPLSGGQPSLLAASNVYVGPLAADKNNVYVSDSQAFGAILSVPIEGGALLPLVSFVWIPVGLAVDEQAVYFGASDPSQETLHRFGLSDQQDTVLAKAGGSPYFIDIDETHVYWTTHAASGRVFRVPKTGGEPSQIAGIFDQPCGFALWGAHIYFTVAGLAADQSGFIARVPKAGGPVETLISGRHQPVCIAADDTALYWVERHGLIKWVR